MVLLSGEKLNPLRDTQEFTVKGYVPPDPEGGVSEVQFAVVYVPRRNRNRFSANCVEIKPGEKEAIADADIDKHYYPAKLLGPSKSSEGQFIYYLVEWLDSG